MQTAPISRIAADRTVSIQKQTAAVDRTVSTQKQDVVVDMAVMAAVDAEHRMDRHKK